MGRKLILCGLNLALFSQCGPAQTNSTSLSALAPQDLQQLRARIAEQQEEIRKLQAAVAAQQKLIEQTIASATSATPRKADGTPVVASSFAATRANEAHLLPAVNGYPRGRQHNLAPSPLAMKVGDSTFTPFGFVDATFFGRSTNAGSGVGTNFGAIPYNTATGSHLSEMNFTTQNSRIGFRVDSEVLGARVLGYFETDFLGNQPGSVFVSSNSDTFRMRNAFVDVQKRGFEFLAGQDWSLMTPNRKGLSPLPSDIFYTQNMDTNYQVGLVWARQTQFRFIAHPSENLAFGVSLENPEQYIGGGNGAGLITPPAAYAAAINSQFNNGNSNYSAPSLHPDIVAKGAYDSHVGDRVMHLEAAALVRSFKFAAGVGSPVKYNSYTATAVSGEVNANLQLFKNFHLIANTFFGSGNGRYIFAQAPDVVVRADGRIAPLHAYSTVDGFEANLAKDTLLYAYYGGIHIDRDQVFDSSAAKLSFVGYGYQGAPNTQNRNIQEGTIGLVRTFWKNPAYGALSLITQYSYLTRNPWYVAVDAPKATHTNMYWIDLRYSLP